MPSKAKKLVGLGRTTAVKTFTRNSNLSIEPRSERQARTLSIATNRGCAAWFKQPLALTFTLVLTALLFSATSSLAAPYKYEKAQSEKLSETVPGETFQELAGATIDAGGNLYVVDRRGNAGKAVIDKFSAENAFLAQLGSAAFTEPLVRSVAVSDETGHVYSGELRSLAEPPFSEVLALSATGEQLSQWTGANALMKSFGEGFVVVAVDNSQSASKGDVYVATPQGSGTVDVFKPQGEDKEEGEFVRELVAPEGGFSFEGQASIAIDNESGEVYVVDAGHKVIDRYSPTGALEAQIEGPTSGEKFKEPVAVAVDAMSGDVFVIDNGAKTIDKLSPTGKLLAQIKETGANELLERPVGLAVQQAGPHAGELYVTDAEKKVIDVFAEQKPAAPLVEGEGVQQVTGDSASFVAEINPQGAPTEYHVEYGPCSGIESCASSPYPSTVPVPDGSLGSEDFATHSTPSFHVQGLSAGTTYHFRVVAHNEVKGKVEVGEGQERTFTTQGAGGEFALPDGRAWELVSPPNKQGAVLSIGGESGLQQAAADGNAVSYRANAPIEKSSPGNSGEVQVLSTRTTVGWDSRDIATPHEAATGNSAGTSPEYRFFSEDLLTSVVQPFGLFNSALSPQASEQTPYLHELAGCTSNCFTPIVTGRAGFANVPAGTHFGEELECEENNGIHVAAKSVCGPQFQGATPDGSHVVFRSAASLVTGVPRNELYEWAGGQLKLVSVLAENQAGKELPAPEGSALLGAQFGQVYGTARRAISADGARVFWESESGGKLYVRDVAINKSLEIDAPEAGCPQGSGDGECEQGGAGRFQIASANGSRVYFTDVHRLTSNSGAKAGEPDLYECRIVVNGEGKLACGTDGPVDLTPSEGGKSADVQGDVLGASEDGSSIYFAADGVLAGSGARRGACVNDETVPQPEGAQCNLYERSDGRGTRLVATLSGGDATVWSRRPERQPDRVSPNGQYLAFMSEHPLTGYDNTDAVSGKPDAEVFLYNADASTNPLICTSCDSTGARPVGVEYKALETGENDALPVVSGEWKNNGWVAALLPHTNAFGYGEPGHQPDYLNDSGRLFFNTLDPLVPQDINGTGDVYEYEPLGYTNEEKIQQCSEETATFASRSGGCIGLISSGTSDRSSAFLDASKSGGDVFFLTSSKLTPEDIDARKDVYDAHECTVKSPCIPPAAATPPPCNTEASCKPSPTPPPGIFGAPPSATFNGAGNLTPPAVVKAKAKPLTRAQKLSKALAACHRDKRKVKRSACEKAARKQFGAVKKAKKRKG